MTGLLFTTRSARKRLAAVLGAMGALAGPGVALGQWNGELVERVDAVFSLMDTDHTPGCSLAVIEEGELVYSEGYGMANLEYGIPLEPTSVFHVASLSKQFTAFAVELLVQAGKVSWHDDIRDYVPELPDLGSRITLDQLAHHTSGIRDQWDLLSMAGWRSEADVIRRRDVLDILSRQEALNFEPGDEYLYSNSGYTLLATVVERVTDVSLREFTSSEIFEPLGMNRTLFRDDHQMIIPDRAYGYAPASGKSWRISIPDFATVGASSLFTTVEDLARWDRNFARPEVGGAKVVENMHRITSLNDGTKSRYAHGLSIGEFRGAETVGHSGADAGYRADYVRFPEHQLSIAVLCNSSGSRAWNLSREVAAIVLEEKLAPEDVSEQTASTLPAPPRGFDELVDKIVGWYVGEVSDIPLHLYEKGGELRLAEGSDSEGDVLTYAEGDRFRVGIHDQTVEFEISRDGVAVTLRNGQGRVTQDLSMAGKPPQRSAQREFVGHYFSPELGTEYEIVLKANRLYLTHRKLETVVLEFPYWDGFRAQEKWGRFTRDAEGEISGFTLSTWRVRRVRFQRVPR